MKKRRFSGNLNGKTHFKVNSSERHFKKSRKKIERQTEFCNTKTLRISARKATATAWRISEDFAKRVSAKPRSAPCRLLRNGVCFYAKTCRSLARAYACALVSKTTARLTGKLRKCGENRLLLASSFPVFLKQFCYEFWCVFIICVEMILYYFL